jgi:hypothetical protein
MMAAVDPRIKLSVPVAGSSPLYHRNTDAGSVGDAEQYYAPLYNENIAPDRTGGGVATWLEIYALGSYGPSRHQVQVTNLHDTCCFSGTFADSYKQIVTDKVTALGTGKFEYYRDDTHHSHAISSHVIDTVINPLFGIQNPLPAPSGLPISDTFGNQTNAFPFGWKLDEMNGPGASAIEQDGYVTIYSTAQAAIAYGSLFNPQAAAPVTVTLEIKSMTADSTCGVFVADNAQRTHLLGVAMNATTKQVVLSADGGGGFNPARDQVVLGALANYEGGAATMRFTFTADGFSVVFDAGDQGTFSSGLRPWSDVPDGFSLASLGDRARLLIQCIENDDGTAAKMVVDSILVESAAMAHAVPEPQTFGYALAALLPFATAAVLKINR